MFPNTPPEEPAVHLIVSRSHAHTQMPNWKPDHFRLFLTHVSTQKSVAHNLKESLEPYYVSCFVAHDDIEPTREWQDEIEEALRAMDALAALLSPDFHTSSWTDQEVGFAVGSGRLVIPLRFGLDPYGFIAKYQGYQITQVPYSTIAQDLLKILARHGPRHLRSGARSSNALRTLGLGIVPRVVCPLSRSVRCSTKIFCSASKPLSRTMARWLRLGECPTESKHSSGVTDMSEATNKAHHPTPRIRAVFGAS
jgi:hypothetical protein